MLEALSSWVERHAPIETQDIHDETLGSYMYDFSKYASQRELAELQPLFKKSGANRSLGIDLVDSPIDMDADTERLYDNIRKKHKKDSRLG